MPRLSRLASAALALLVALSSSARGQAPLTLSWDPPGGAAPAGYVVQWGTAPGTYGASAFVAAGQTAYVVEGLAPGLRYYFTAVALDAAGSRSEPSNEVTVVPWAAPAGTRVPAVRDGLARMWLTVSATGAGRGIVAVRPGATACEDRCSVQLPRDTPVVLAASARPGSRFVAWEGCQRSGPGICEVRLDAARDVRARFEPDVSSSSTFTVYLAEGAAGGFFETRLALANPGGRAVVGRLRFLRDDGVEVRREVVVEALASVRVEASDVPGLSGHAFSTVVESDAPVVVDRTMAWRGADGLVHGAHAESALPSPAPRWYLAEGATHAGFDLFYLLQNPQDVPVTTRITYLRAEGAPLERVLHLPPRSRTSVWVDEETFGPDAQRLLAASEVSAIIETADGRGIVVERAMYASRRGATFDAGHGSAGVTAPARRWSFAEGATGPFFDEFLLVANPQDVPADLTVTYLLPDGTRVQRVHRVGPRTRYTIWVDKEGALLADTAVSAIVEASVPVVAERSMWWPGHSDTWREAHNAAGATRAGVQWAVADGEASASGQGHATYLLIANPTDQLAEVRVTLLFRVGIPPVTRMFSVGANSRFGLSVADAFPEARGLSCGALVDSVGAEVPIIVERAMYRDAPGQPWASGTNLLATRLR